MVHGRRLFGLVSPILALLIALGGPLVLSLGGHAASAQASQCWSARITEQWTDVQLIGSVLRVSVEGKPGLPVTVRSMGDFQTLGFTATKPEYGPYVVEFAPLSKGTYFIEPEGLNTIFAIWLDGKSYVRVDFASMPCAATSTPTPSLPIPTPTPTLRPLVTSMPIFLPPVSSPTPYQPVATQWTGSIVENHSGTQATEHAHSAIAVVVEGKPWHEVEILSNGWSTTTQTGTKPDYGPHACEFGGLRAATYTVIPKGLGTSIQVTMDGWGWAMVRFEEVPAPAPQPAIPSFQMTPMPVPSSQPEPAPTLHSPPATTGWQAWIVSNSSGEQEGTGVWSVIVVRVLGWAGVPVAITGGGGWTATCTTGSKPEHGPDACDFGGLWPGTYRLHPQGSDLSLEVTMDGLGVAVVEFARP
ncbi:hypothetical protein ACFLUM_01920 [Chloroflexota bacterium]